MIKLNTYKRIAIIFYIFFYLISAKFAIGRNLKNEILIDLEKGLNSREFSFIDKYFAANKKNILMDKLKNILKDFPDAKWELNKTNNISSDSHIIDVKIRGSKIINGEKYILDSNFDFFYSVNNGEINNEVIKNHLTIIRSDNNLIDLNISIPDRVLTGSNYDIDIIIENPLEGDVIAGMLKEYEDKSLIETPINLVPLASGGLFKVTRAPIKPGIQIWSGMISHPKGIISFTKTVDIIERY